MTGTFLSPVFFHELAVLLTCRQTPFYDVFRYDRIYMSRLMVAFPAAPLVFPAFGTLFFKSHFNAGGGGAGGFGRNMEPIKPPIIPPRRPPPS